MHTKNIVRTKLEELGIRVSGGFLFLASWFNGFVVLIGYGLLWVICVNLTLALPPSTPSVS